MKIWKRLPNILFFLVVGYLLYARGPEIVRRFETEGTSAPRIEVPLLNGQKFDSTLISGPMIVVFWATWCGPCKTELYRINNLVKNQKIPAESVIAVSIKEDRATVENEVKNKNYLFQVGLDFSGQSALDYNVEGTPTIALINADKTIDWITTGMSPTLEIRILSHF